VKVERGFCNCQLSCTRSQTDSKRHSHGLLLSALWGFCDGADQTKVEGAKRDELLKTKQNEYDNG